MVIELRRQNNLSQFIGTTLIHLFFIYLGFWGFGVIKNSG
jgi:hypothetical protein